MKLEGIRNKIDKIDRELLVLLQERMGLALRSRKFQESAVDSKQEAEALDRMKRLNLDLVKSAFRMKIAVWSLSKESMALTVK
jgi:chorismate mutase